MIRKIKDKTLSQGIALAVDAKIKRYGKMLKLELDSKDKSIRMEILLKGEIEPLHVQIRRYEILEEEGRHYLLAEEIHTSREWINVIAQEYLASRRFEIPQQYAKMLKLIV